MNASRARCHLWLSLAAAFLLLFAVPSGHAAPKPRPKAAGRNAPATFSPAAYVDPFIGTGTGPGSSINLFPGPSLPFGLVQPGPDTEDRGYGYHYYQHEIHGFSMTHMSGPGCDNEGDIFFTATTGPVHTQIKNFQSPYSHAQESARPGYYRVMLTRWNTQVELTSTLRAGLARFHFPAGRRANVLLPISHTLNSTVSSRVDVVSDHEITGYVEDHCFCGSSQTYKVYFDMVFSRPFKSFGVWQGKSSSAPSALSAGSRVAAQTKPGQWIGAYASWPSAPHASTVTVRIGISYVDAAGAARNLQTETHGRSFDQVRDAAYAAWNKALDVIHVSGGAPGERKVFYTALYHCLLMPSIFSDADGRYLGFDGQVHHAAPGHLVYANYSGWDIYRSEMPLLALIVPRQFEDMCQSIVLMYQQGGWIGRWPQVHHYTNVMAGSPLTTVLAMAWLDGLHGFDINAAWEGMVKDATTAPPAGKPYQGQASIGWINKIHYVPNDKERYGSVSQLQEDGIAYVSLYYLAKARHDAKAARLFYDRALYIRNLFDPADRFFRPRNADGQWMADFDPSREQSGDALFRELHKMPPARQQKVVQAFGKMRNMSLAQREQFLGTSQVRKNFSAQERNLLERASRMLIPTGFIEGSGWHYQWLAPYDMHWLIGAVGQKLFNQRLETFFSYKKPGWYGQYYNPYNETDLEAPFEFNFSGEPWQTQRVVRRVLRENYTLSVNGIPGNDDCGEMSSWAVLSMMGIYTVDPASTAYELVSPVFSRVAIRLQAPYAGHEFVIETNPDPASHPYIQKVSVNGQGTSRDWIRFADITRGGHMRFTLGANANHNWGAAPADAPPSLSEQRP